MQDTPFVIDKNTYKVMKYIYRKKKTTISNIIHKFKNIEEPDVLAIYLCVNKYAVYFDIDRKPYFDAPSYSDFGNVALTPLGNKYIEDKKRLFVQWFVPVMCSISSVLISIIALIISLSNSNNEFFIHLL